MKMNNVYSANEFINRLSDDKLRMPLICEGFTKPIENNREAFLFSPGTSCGNWIKISAEMIEKVEFTGDLSCRDHSHPLVRIHFKEPPPDDSFGTAFASLLRSSNTNCANPDQSHHLMKEEHREPSWVEKRLAELLWETLIGRGLGRDEDTRKPTGELPRLRRCNDLRQQCEGLGKYENIGKTKRQKACDALDALDCE